MRSPSFTEIPAGPLADGARQFMVRMRDGVRLATDVYLPAAEIPATAVLTRLPYDKSGAMVCVELAARAFTSRGYAFVAQDTRGKFRSEGETVPWINEALDGYDTIEWIVNQEWSDGRVGMHGSSYVGFTQWAALSTDHPALRAITPRNTSIRLGGRELSPGEPEWSYHVRYLLDFYASHTRHEADDGLDWTHRPLLDVIDAAVAEIGHRSPVLDLYLSAHGTFNRYPVGHPFAAKPIPVLICAGWLDPYHVSRAIEDYQTLAAVPAWTSRVHLRLTPHDHEDTRLGARPLSADRPPGPEQLDWWLEDDLRFLDRYLRDDAAAAAPAPVEYELVHGEGRQSAPSWPPPESETRELHLAQGDGGNHQLQPMPDATPTAVSWTHDPDALIPTQPDVWALFASCYPDYRERLRRHDLLVFRGQAAEEEIRLAGPVTLHARVSSTGPQMDLFVQLLDLEPDGHARFITQGQRRLDATNPTDVSLRVGHAGYVVRQGHTLVLALSSSDFPDFIPLTGTGERWWTAREPRATTQTLALGGHAGARLELTVLPTPV